MSDDVAFLSAEDLVAAFRARSLSPVEVTEAMLERIELVNPVVNAFTTVSDGRGWAPGRRALFDQGPDANKRDPDRERFTRRSRLGAR